MSSKGGLNSAAQVVGFKYFLSMFMGVCRGPVNAVIAIRVGDRLAWSGSHATTGRVAIAKPDLFGGDDKEGGIDGSLDVLFGNETQVLADGNPYAILNFDGQPAIDATLTIGGHVFTFVEAPPPPDVGSSPGGNEGGGPDGDGGGGAGDPGGSAGEG